MALVFTLGGGKRASFESPRTAVTSPAVTASPTSPTVDHQAEKPSAEAAARKPEPVAAMATSSPKPAASTPAAGATTGTAKAAAASAHPSIRSEFSVGKTVNLAPLLDLVGDRVAGVWHARGENLLSPDTEYARIRVPVTPPADYRLKIVARRVAGKDALGLGLGLVVGGAATVLCLDYGAQGTAFAWYDGKAGPATSSYRSQVIFNDNQPRTIQCTVYPGHVVAMSDDKTIFEWSGNHKLLSATVKYAIPDKQCLFLASHNSVFEIRKLELTPLDAGPAGTARASSSVASTTPKPSATASATAATKPAARFPAPTKASPAANTPPAASTAAAQPTTLKTAQPLSGAVDLLKLVELKKGAVGSWLQEAGALVRTGTGGCRAPIPFLPPKDYDLVVTVAGPVGQTDNSFVFVVEGRKVGFQYTPRLPAPTIIFDCRQPVNMAYRPVSISDVNATQANFVCSVCGPRVYITVDDQPMLDWTGDPKTLEVWSWHDIASCAGFIAAARGKEPGLRFTKFEISPPGLNLPEFGRVDWLALVNPKRDRTSGEPHSEGGDLVLPPTIEPKGSNVGVNIAHSSEYVVTAVVERLNGRGELGAGMMIGDHRAAAQVDALGQTSFSTVATFTRDWLLTPWRQHTLTYEFTAQSAHLKIDGREVLNYPQPPFNIRSIGDLDVADPRISTIHSHYLASFQISSWEVTPLGWKKHARPSASQLADAVKSLLSSLAPARAKDAKAEQKSTLAESLWRQAAISSDDDARRFALLDAAALLAAQAGNLPLACHAATDLARWFEGENKEWFTTLATEMMKAGRTTADRQKLASDSLRQIDRAQALEEFDLAVALQIAALAAARPANSDAAKELKARGSELRFYQTERTAYLPAQAAVDAGQANATANRTVGRYLGLVRGDWTAAARVLEQTDDPILLAIAKGELTPSDEAEQQFAQAERWWSLFEKGESPLKFLAMQRAAIWYRRAGSKLSGKAKITLDQRRRVVAMENGRPTIKWDDRKAVDLFPFICEWEL